MTGSIRMAVLLVMGSVFVAGAAMAGVPTWAQSSQPNAIRIGGEVGGVGQSAAASTYTIRDGNSFGVSNTRVLLNFSTCTGIYLCAAQDAGLTKVGSTIEGTTDFQGVLSFKIRGRSIGGAGYSGTCVTVSLPDFPSAGAGSPLVAGAFELNVPGGVDAQDLSAWGTDANSCSGGTHKGRADYTSPAGSCPGGIDAGDLSIWGTAANQSPNTSLAVCP